MSERVTVIMYHYVRPLQRTRFPRIKGLDSSFFEQQLQFILRHYNVVSMEQVVAAFWEEVSLPRKAALLTFDDGYLDHYTYVFPRLEHFGVQGSFFAPVAAVADRKLLDMNLIHLILASVPDNQTLLNEVFASLDRFRMEWPIESNQCLYEKYAEVSRWDPPEIVFVKELLQTGLEFSLRRLIIEDLLGKYVGTDPAVLAEEFYMTADQLRTMARHGMHIGAHGYNHTRLASMNNKDRDEEVSKSYEFLKSIGADTSCWTMCYPYGEYDSDLITRLADADCKLAFTVEPGIAEITWEKRHKVPRLDTNDLPKQATAETNRWYDLA